MIGRRSIRIPRFDYSASHAYFVTIVTMNRHCLFGAIDESLETNDAGRMVQEAWQSLASRFAGLGIDTFVVMPNHLHGIVNLDGAAAALGRVIGAFKSLTTLNYARNVVTLGWAPFQGRLWQRNYYEHVIRGRDELDRVRKYVVENPLAWALDPENPGRPQYGLSKRLL